MARVTLGDFRDRTWHARIYLAAELAQAKRVEVMLRANGRDYAVEVEPYVRLSAAMESKPQLTPGETDGP